MKRVAGWLLAAGLAAAVAPAASQDLSGDLLNVVYDVASKPVPPEAKAAQDLLKAEGLLPGQRLRAIQQAGLLERWGRALAMGTRSPQFAAEIGAVRDAAVKRDPATLHAKVEALYRKAGRTPPTPEAMKELEKQIRTALGSEREETIRRTVKKGDRTIDVSYAPLAGMAQVEVTQPGPDGKPTRTVFRGEEKTKPTADGKDIETVIEPVGPCVMNEQTSAQARDRLNGVWKSGDGRDFTIASQVGAVTIDEQRLKGRPLRYSGTYQLGKIIAFHPFEQIEDMEDNLPPSVRSQLIAWKPKLGFTLRFDVCGAAGELRGTWSSQHVTYSGTTQSVNRVHDPYDLSLQLSRGGGGEGVARGATDEEAP